jgi:hypothetical protein
MDAGGKVIDTKTVDYGETVTPPDSSVTWTCNAYADWQNTKDGPQQRIVYSWDTQGKGTKDDPFLITSAAGWNNLRVKTENSGTKGEYYKLMNDISVKTTIGTKDRPFEGIFEGNGKTLTINYSNTDNDERTAPFAYTRDVTIRNLTIEGSIEGSGDHAAGVLGENEGWTLIRNCIVSASIKGGKYVGGFSIGAGGTLKIQDCAFYGLIIGTTDCGGFVAYGSDTLVLRDCLFAPLSGSSIQSGATFVNKEWDSLDECYYYTALGTPQGHEKVKESSGSAKEQEEMAKAEYDSAVASAKNLKVGNVTAKAKTGRKAVISWKKNKSADGYQIRYSPDKNFEKSIKFVNINKSKMKKTLTKLKAGKTWFVQIRTYKKIKNPTDGKTSTIYGKWSKVKKVKIKK